MWNRGAQSFVAAVVLAASSACSTHYTPRAGPRISMVMEGGSPAYTKNGKVYKHGFAGGGLVEAVSDDAEALEAAETYQSRTTTGFLLVLAGTVCLTASIVLVATRDPFDERDASNDRLAVGTALCGLGGYIGGAAVLASGQPYHFDAINIYNDKVDKRRFRPSGGYGAPPHTQPVPYAPPPGVAPQRPAPVAPPPVAQPPPAPPASSPAPPETPAPLP